MIHIRQLRLRIRLRHSVDIAGWQIESLLRRSFKAPPAFRLAGLLLSCPPKTASVGRSALLIRRGFDPRCAAKAIVCARRQDSIDGAILHATIGHPASTLRELHQPWPTSIIKLARPSNLSPHPDRCG